MSERKLEHSIFTFTGQRFWPLEPRAGEINILDIAHALSNQGRFTGHTREFYSVAQHSVLVSRILPPEYALWGLLHDATEAYLIDLARPVKMQMPEFKQVESRLEEVVAEAFNLPLPMPEAVHHADRILLMTEKRDLMPQAGTFSAVHSGGALPLPEVITPWSPPAAKAYFLQRYRELTVPVPAEFQACDPFARVNSTDAAVSKCDTEVCGIERDIHDAATVALAERIANGRE